MADTWIQGSFVFRCTDLELALVEEAFEASYQLTDADIATPPPSANFAAHFRPTGIGRSKLYELIDTGEIETFKVGTMTLIPVASIRRFLSSKGMTE